MAAGESLPSSAQQTKLRHCIYADAGDDGFRFIFPAGAAKGGLVRESGQGHFVTVVGRGGTGKSILALQLATHLVPAGKVEARKPAAFYFTLESSPAELVRQVSSFEWGKRYKLDGSTSELLSSDGLYIVPIPAPAEDLTSLALQIRQTIANHLAEFSELAAIVIDPLGGVTLATDLRSELGRLKDMCDSHGTFLFLLTEDHVFQDHRSIEHFSQSVIHLDHDPTRQPSRRLYIQKARNQVFRSGYHQFDLDENWGVRVYPSMQAQSDYAHTEGRIRSRPSGAEKKFITDEGSDITIQPGSAIFLMGPPGTFKQSIATEFCQAISGRTLYISFKADVGAVKIPPEQMCVLGDEPELDAKKVENASCLFLDARSPLKTPEEILSKVRITVERFPATSTLRRLERAVVWGLRRLSDLPNFSDGKSVQFLEALVTLLKAYGITPLLVDWPDIEKANTLPIVDLCQYIFLTRLCHSEALLNRPSKESTRRDRERRSRLSKVIWGGPRSRTEHAALLRVQREGGGFRRDKGLILLRRRGENDPKVKPVPSDVEFEELWLETGDKWERDPGLG